VIAISTRIKTILRKRGNEIIFCANKLVKPTDTDNLNKVIILFYQSILGLFRAPNSMPSCCSELKDFVKIIFKF